MKTKKQINTVKLTPEKIRINLKKLGQEIRQITEIMSQLQIPQEVLEKEIKPFGNASHIILPKEYSGKKGIIILKK